MLIEFSVSNFRSFREIQTFSMVAAPRLKKRNCVFKPNAKGEKLPDLLKVAAIYGPNASGKSNLLKALGVVQTLTKFKPSVEPRVLPVMPFRFDENLIAQPSRFEIHFIQNRQRYQFELAVTMDRIFEERLIAYPLGVETLLYERVYDGTSESYVMGEALDGGSELHKVWQQLTSPQVLFISQAVANSSEDLRQLRHPLSWLQSQFTVLDDSDMEAWGRHVAKIGSTLKKFDVQLSEYLREIDVPISEIAFENEESEDLQDSSSDKSNATHVPRNRLALLEKKTIKTILTHKTALGEKKFEFHEESKGTRNLMGFFLPWKVMTEHQESHLLLVDELDSSLHPKIVAALVQKHLLNSGVGQLIFTTHDTHLMDTKLLRRDQFWLTERDANGATKLRSIHEFRGRESEDVEKRYYEGQYRGLPIFPSEIPADIESSGLKRED